MDGLVSGACWRGQVYDIPRSGPLLRVISCRLSCAHAAYLLKVAAYWAYPLSTALETRRARGRSYTTVLKAVNNKLDSKLRSNRGAAGLASTPPSSTR